MKLESITIATTNMEPMVSFYESVFDFKFNPVQMYGSTLYCPSTVLLRSLCIDTIDGGSAGKLYDAMTLSQKQD